jgi:iron complex outermembrane receptor protein
MMKQGQANLTKVWGFLLGLSIAGSANAGYMALADGDASPDLSQMSLEDLMNVEVTSVSKHKQKISEAAAAVTVITQDDIQHSGLHSIPEMLRLSPGLSVARIDANKWAISSRGFADQFANKLLVMMDGRTVYTPLFSGVVWDTQDYVLEDLDRIEVIRGPGATLWGSNAVNGVINITTKSAKDTQGLLVSGLGSNVDELGEVRYGGKIDDSTFYRVFALARKTQDFVDATGHEQFDGWQALRGGFRLDRYSTHVDTLTLSGEAYQNISGDRENLPTLTPPLVIMREDTARNGGEHILGKWTHTVSPESEYSLQMYYDDFYRDENEIYFDEQTLDLEFQHRLPIFERNSLTYGLGTRFIFDRTRGTEQVMLDPPHQDNYRLSTFVQDDVTLVPDRLHLILGSKFEYSSYSEWEYQPSGRLLWTPNDKNTVWAAVSRAVRTPTRSDKNGTTLVQAFPGEGGIPTGIVAGHDDDLHSEQMMAYELGYRVKPMPKLSIDIAGFWNHYEGLRSYETGAPILNGFPPTSVVVPQNPINGIDANTYGVETGVNVNVTDDLRLAGSYSLVRIDAYLRDNSQDAVDEHKIEGSSPQNQAQFHAYYHLTRQIDLNASVYYVETLPAYDVPSYVRTDLSASWRPKKDVVLTIGVQNLFDDRHPEFGPALYNAATEMPRTVYAQASVQF